MRAMFSGSALALLAALAPSRALAAPPPLSVPTTSDQTVPGDAASSSFLSNLRRSNYLLGDLFGVRPLLSRYGISIAIQETSEVLGNATGGYRRGVAYDGLTQAILQLDTQRGFGWYGGVFNISALQLHGRNLSADNLGSLQTASGIEGDRATRLWEAWYDQKLLPEDRLSIRIGQQSLDQEFIVDAGGAYFVNTMFGWPLLPSVDLPGGGPAYPLSALGVRFRYRPINQLAILAGVFNGSPTSARSGDAQMTNPSGLSLPTNGGTLAIVEMQYTYPALGSLVLPGAGAPLGHTYRIGAWYNSERFADQRLDAQGGPLAAPDSSSDPRTHQGNYSVYAVADQMVWRDPTFPNRSVSVFARAMGTPQGDRNLVDFSINAGVLYHAPLRGRPDDTIGLGFGYGHVSPRVSAYDRDVATFAQASDPGSFNPVRRSETFVEATYQRQIRPWWQIQPDIQYVFNPGGDIANADGTARIGNELVLGVRTNILF